jgi:hypothetical protein
MDDSEVIFVTGGYDHSIKFWRPQNGVCYRSASHSDSVSLSLLSIWEFPFYEVIPSIHSAN